ncbi:hypothetical protein DOTSEDRAFT_163924 [Dothistroma septosporum NZE10]|uniref:Uncharacterized protein n=1 Tax=Dothistroma septosporum (strain NZE10 / CBS 128990) TaxID=675120 RepID=N1Q447_DOTSN|nr:hypothetical protein DOTSEDRAFT_163924 [Dothistroma septosporum NZE10]
MLRRLILTWRPRASAAGCSAVQQGAWASPRYFARAAEGRDAAGARDGSWDESSQSGPAEPPRAGTQRNTNKVFMGVVGTPSPKTTSIQDLISQIKPKTLRASMHPNTYPSLLTVLTTPSYAKQALLLDLPTEIAKRFGDNPTASKPLDAIVAVVDRLPLPNGTLKGTEGLAYAFSTSRRSLDTSTQVPLNASAQKPGTLSFTLPEPPDATLSERQRKRRGTAVTTIQLPLAQTIFSNGLPSTLLHNRYQFDPLSGTLRKSASQHLEAQTLHLDLVTQPVELAASIPLIPLTPLREVQHSMGNIVQKVSSDRFHNVDVEPEASSKLAKERMFSSAVVPASQELEQAVSDYFKSVRISPQPVQVWAVIVSASSSELLEQRADTDDVPEATQRLLSLQKEDVWKQWVPSGLDRGLSSAILRVVQEGGRMCKVLSGGGGWGKKAGLLSLDPDVEYSTRDLRSEAGWQFDFDGDDSFDTVQRQRKQALGEIVKKGDGVMFLLAPKDADGGACPSRTSISNSRRAVSLGVVPSSIDEHDMPSVGDSGGKSSIAERPEHYANFFGMLSEGGMAISVICPREGTLTQSKMDVPFQRLSIVEQPGKDIVGPDTGAPSTRT